MCGLQLCRFSISSAHKNLELIRKCSIQQKELNRFRLIIVNNSRLFMNSVSFLTG